MAERKSIAFVANAVAKRDGRDFFTRVGVAFHNDSPDHPITVVLNPGVTITADKLVLSVPKERETEA